MLLFSVGTLFLLGVFSLLLFAHYLVSPAQRGAPEQTLVVERGSSLRQVAGQLEEQGLIRGRAFFEGWARLMGFGNRIKAGEYRLSGAMSPMHILEMLAQGRVIRQYVTIPEGFNLMQIAALLEREGLVSREAFGAAATDPEVLSRYGLQGPSPEGYLFPDTYLFDRTLPPEVIVETLLKRFQEIITPLAQEIEDSPFTLHEVITLASMVEKETGAGHERPLIASVFLNRLKKGMRMDCDPTVIYGLEDFDGKLTRKHLNTPTPYNTYMIRGLPPGPIANPGLASIRAVLSPAQTSYLYFVSRNDGTHHFSKSLDEHNRAVYRYQRQGRTAGGKSS